jgi:hypothetical protein
MTCRGKTMQERLNSLLSDVKGTEKPICKA